ncbi:MAG: ATPase synthesis protein 25 mitochondrial [Piccolia ochrophora]|nr:MAG: ATPase synthesis protein 25 mitochondrial [Piccolia ochrophora]
MPFRTSDMLRGPAFNRVPCNACRRVILSSLLSISATLPAPRISTSSRASNPFRHARISTRDFSVFRPISFEVTRRLPTIEVPSAVQAEAPTEDEEDVSSAKDGLHSTTPWTPWYLQEKTVGTHSPPRERNRHLPDLPKDPPSILKPLLGYLSIDVGLDDLQLLDLRKLDPPPALGSLLIMIVGSARSDKHLHVSADRLCRWLRTEHRLTPVADGLLGRNELKVKMRRKARRAKLLGSVGAPDRTAVEEGIRSGWICVDFGIVDDGAIETTEIQPTAGFVGFDTARGGSRVVVQMLTEQKREELDLETLWTKSRDRGTPEYPHDSLEEQETKWGDAKSGLSASRWTSIHNSGALVSTSRSTTDQRRALHTSSRDSASIPQVAEGEFAEQTHLAATSRDWVRSRSLTSRDPQHPLHELVDAGDYQAVRHLMFSKHSVSLTSDEAKTLQLRAHLNYLRKLFRGEAQKILGKGSDDFASQPFLLSFYQTIPTFASTEHLQCRIELFCHAVEVRHPGYTKEGLVQLLNRTQARTHHIHFRIFEMVLRAILNRKPIVTTMTEETIEVIAPVSEADLFLATTILESMERHGYPIFTEDIFVLLHEAIGFPTPISPPNKVDTGPLLDSASTRVTVTLQEFAKVSSRQFRLNALAKHFGVSITQGGALIRLLTLYANQAHWRAFWELWSLPARCFQARSAELYAFMFRTIARTGHQAQCMRTLREHIPEMEKEEPRVPINGDVAKSIMACLRVADPWVEEESPKPTGLKGEWVHLWRVCEKGLESESNEVSVTPLEPASGYVDRTVGSEGHRSVVTVVK